MASYLPPTNLILWSYDLREKYLILWKDAYEWIRKMTHLMKKDVLHIHIYSLKNTMLISDWAFFLCYHNYLFK